MNPIYMTVIYAPLVLIVLFCIMSMFQKSDAMPLLSVAGPVLIGAFELLGATVATPAERDVLTEILSVQSGWLGIIGAVFGIYHYVIRPLARMVHSHRPHISVL